MSEKMTAEKLQNEMDSLLERLVKQLPENIHPDDVTINMIMERGHLGYEAARKFLEQKVADGMLKHVEVVASSGRVTIAYRENEHIVK